MLTHLYKTKRNPYKHNSHSNNKYLQLNQTKKSQLFIINQININFMNSFSKNKLLKSLHFNFSK